MIIFPNAKINIGLRIIEKRTDGYHNLETVFYPVGWCDALETVVKKGKTSLGLSGIPVPGRRGGDNLCIKLYEVLKKKHHLPPLAIWLQKAIPVGAGLGGGSSDAAHFMKLLNTMFMLNLTVAEMKEYVSQLGSDCAFFIENKPALATGRGEVTEPIDLDLGGLHIAIIYPGIVISTAEAYRLITPCAEGESLKKLLPSTDLREWKNCVANDFETPVIKLYPAIGAIKQKLYDMGAVYASMTGSGSAVYGIFDKEPATEQAFKAFKTWKGKLSFTA